MLGQNIDGKFERGWNRALASIDNARAAVGELWEPRDLRPNRARNLERRRAGWAVGGLLTLLGVAAFVTVRSGDGAEQQALTNPAVATGEAAAGAPLPITTTTVEQSAPRPVTPAEQQPGVETANQAKVPSTAASDAGKLVIAASGVQGGDVIQIVVSTPAPGVEQSPTPVIVAPGTTPLESTTATLGPTSPNTAGTTATTKPNTTGATAPNHTDATPTTNRVVPNSSASTASTTRATQIIPVTVPPTEATPPPTTPRPTTATVAEPTTPTTAEVTPSATHTATVPTVPSPGPDQAPSISPTGGLPPVSIENMPLATRF